MIQYKDYGDQEGYEFAHPPVYPNKIRTTPTKPPTPTDRRRADTTGNADLHTIPDASVGLPHSTTVQPMHSSTG
jgi:hypothetical protein